MPNSDCPSGTFSNFDNNLCVTTCPADTYYMEGSRPNCTERCPQNFYGSPIDKKCKEGNLCPTSPIRYYADDTSNLCVEKCPTGYYSDTTTNRCLVFCSSGYFADDTSGTGRCVQNCPDEYFRDNSTRSCLRKCPKGSYINEQSGNCTDQCSSPYYGDNSTGKCEE